MPVAIGYSSINSNANIINLITYVSATKNAALDLSSLSDNIPRTFTFPNASGTVALTSDLGSYLPLTGGTMTGQIVLKESSSSTDYTKGLRFPNDPFGGAGDTSGLRLYADTATGVEAQILELYITNDTTGISQDKINFAAPSNDFVTINSYKIWNAGNLTPQSQLNGTGFVKASGTTISYDNSTYLTTSSAASIYVPYTGTGISVIGLSAIGEYDGGAQIPAGYGGSYALTLGNGAIGNGLSLYTTGYINAGAITTAGFSRVTNATASTSTTTGAFVVTGGVGIGGALYGTSATFSSSVTAQGAKSQFIADGGASAGAGISLNTQLSGSDRRNWYIGTEENVSGDFAIKCSTAAGGSGNAGTTRLAILNSGNVGIGTTNPSTILTIYNNRLASFTTQTINNLYLQSQTYDGSGYNTIDFGSTSYAKPLGRIALGLFSDGSSMSFGTSNSYSTGITNTALTITSGGNVLIGRTTSGLNNTEGVTISGGSLQPESTGYVIYGNRTTSDGLFMGIRRNNVDVGSITVTTATTSFNITSDYRLKQDLKQFSGLELISKIKTYDYQWKLDKSRMYGVIAHELEEVLPYAVFGKKDEINENGDVKPQAVDYSKLVPLLINAMQEQQAQIEELKSKIN